MKPDVYADSNQIAAKSGMGKVIASFPDVCLSPPSPPAGPIPIPYPDTSFSSDLKEGTRTVRLAGKPAALAQQSYYKPSVLGDEAATKTLGMNVITHQITGKTYFQAWSMDVKFEGKSVCRHVDITTSNHASAPGGALTPNPNLDALATGAQEDTSGTCACCGKARHAAGKPMAMDDWYTQDKAGAPAPWAADYHNLVTRIQNRKSLSPKACSCNGTVLPSKPCNVFRRPVTDKEHKQIEKDWDRESERWQIAQGIRPDMKAIRKKRSRPPYMAALSSTETEWLRIAESLTTATNMPSSEDIIREKYRQKTGKTLTDPELQDYLQGNHLTPKDAGGCPTGSGNLQHNGVLCDVCQGFDREFGLLQTKISQAGINR